MSDARDMDPGSANTDSWTEDDQRQLMARYEQLVLEAGNGLPLHGEPVVASFDLGGSVPRSEGTAEPFRLDEVFIRLENTIYGPVSQEELGKMLASGELTGYESASSDLQHWTPLIYHPRMMLVGDIDPDATHDLLHNASTLPVASRASQPVDLEALAEDDAEVPPPTTPLARILIKPMRVVRKRDNGAASPAAAGPVTTKPQASEPTAPAEGDQRPTVPNPAIGAPFAPEVGATLQPNDPTPPGVPITPVNGFASLSSEPDLGVPPALGSLPPARLEAQPIWPATDFADILPSSGVAPADDPVPVPVATVPPSAADIALPGGSDLFGVADLAGDADLFGAPEGSDDDAALEALFADDPVVQAAVTTEQAAVSQTAWQWMSAHNLHNIVPVAVGAIALIAAIAWVAWSLFGSS